MGSRTVRARARTNAVPHHSILDPGPITLDSPTTPADHVFTTDTVFTSRVRCLYLNARSAAKSGALDALSEFCENNNIQVLLLCETWFNDNIRDAEISLRGKFHVWRNDRGARGGGVCILTRHALSVTAVSINHAGEFVSIDLHGTASKIRVTCCYLSNSGDAATRRKRTHDCAKAIESLCSIDHPTIIIGDFNFPLIRWNQPDSFQPSSKESMLLECCESNNLLQMINFPTHKSGNTLDLLLTGNPELVERLIPTSSPVPTDHIAISFDIILDSPPQTMLTDVLDFRNMDHASIAAHLDIVDWTRLFAPCNSVDEMYNEFVACCRFLIEEFTPRRAPPPSFINLDINISRLETSLVIDGVNRDMISKRLKKAIIRKRTLTESGLDFRDSRAFYRYSNSRLKGFTPIPTLIAPGSRIVSSSQKADYLACHFAQTFSTPICVRTRPPPCPTQPPLVFPDITVTFTEELVCQRLAELPSKTSQTPDLIPPIFLKTFRLFLSEPLAIIFQRSYEDGIAPSLFRCGTVTPVHKKGSKDDVSNYRPVTQCTIACSIFEKIIASHITGFMKINNLFDPQQHGFVPYRSTCTQLLNMAQTYTEFNNAGITFHAIYFDLKAAFDKVDHARLLDKMKNLGIHSKTIEWCRSYLSNRSFRVRVESQLSVPHPANSGVPQGGALSPLLYILYSLDIRDYLPASTGFLSFADDLKIFGPARTIDERARLQTAVDGIVNWCNDNHMVLSPSKCMVLTKSADPSDNPGYRIHDTVLPVVDSIRDLGVMVSSDLDFDDHIVTTVNSARILVNSIFRCFIVRKSEFYIRLYVSLVIPKILYCCPVWIPHKIKHIRKIEAIRSYFIRRLRIRCTDDVNVSDIPPIMSVLHAQDIRILRRIVLLDETGHYFEIRPNSLRSLNTVRSKSIAKNETVNNSFSWRICAKINSRDIPTSIFGLAHIRV